MGNLIRVENATAVYDGKVVLDDVTWRMAAGEHWFVLGRNGSGKTTLMNVLMAYKWPRLGATVEVLGNRYGVGVVVQDVRRQVGWFTARLKDWTKSTMTAERVVLSGFDATIGLYREATDDEVAAARAKMGEFDCAYLGDQPFGTMSSGEQMKVLLARATILDPKLLILDEPCCHLDMGTREVFLETIEQLAAKPSSPGIILVTHRIDDITPLFTHGLILKEGRAVDSGKRDEILTGPTLTDAFGVPITLHQSNGRYWPVGG
jgi:iron complex transport system ATP-binding protein